MSDLWLRWSNAPPVLPLEACPARLPDPSAIPPRAWLYGTRLVRGFVSVLVAPGGAGKSALALAQGLALVSGQPILRERVHHSVKVWLLNLEDPIEETERRLAALMRLHAIAADQVRGRLFLNSGRARRLAMAEPDGMGIVHPDRDAMVAQALAQCIGTIIVDPFVKSHRLEENSNAHMDAAATAWSDVAERTGAAVLLVHHVRKAAGPGGAGDIDIARGAKALTDAARSAAVLNTMTEHEALHLGVPARDRWRHVRLDDAKANLAPRAEGALWYRMETVALGNASSAYPQGDQVGAVAAWTPPSPMRGLTPAQCDRALDQIAAGAGGGQFYASARNAGAGRWAGTVLVQGFGLPEEQAARVIALWLPQGVLTEAPYHDPIQRKPRLGLRVVDSQRPMATR